MSYPLMMVVMKSATMGQRAWFAWKCLPRDPKGNPPSWRELEEAHDLSNGSIHKIVWDLTTRPSFEQISKVAEALKTTAAWLQAGNGEGPKASWSVEERPDPEAVKLRAARSRPTLSHAAEAAFSKDEAKLAKRVKPVTRRDARK